MEVRRAIEQAAGAAHHLGQAAGRESSDMAPTLRQAEPPESLLDLAASTNTDVRFGAPLSQLLQESAEYRIVGAAVVPVSQAARSLAQTPVGSDISRRIAAFSDVVRSSPAGRIDRVILAPSVETMLAARAVARADVLASRGAGGADLPQRLKSAAASLSLPRERFIEGEYLPSNATMILGPLANAAVRGSIQGADLATTTRANVIVAHEIAHARQPLDDALLQQQPMLDLEEGRAVLVSGGTLLNDVAAVTGLAFDPGMARADGTYAPLKAQLEARLRAAGRVPEQPQTLNWLDSTAATTIHATLPAG